MDMLVLQFNFTGLHPDVLLNADGRGHYNLFVMTDVFQDTLLTEKRQDEIRKGHTLPP
jgi:hypothetical protein